MHKPKRNWGTQPKIDQRNIIINMYRFKTNNKIVPNKIVTLGGESVIEKKGNYILNPLSEFKHFKDAGIIKTNSQYISVESDKSIHELNKKYLSYLKIQLINDSISKAVRNVLESGNKISLLNFDGMQLPRTSRDELYDIILNCNKYKQHNMLLVYNCMLTTPYKGSINEQEAHNFIIENKKVFKGWVELFPHPYKSGLFKCLTLFFYKP